MTYKTIATKIPILQQIQTFEWKNRDEFIINVPETVCDKGSTTLKMRKICQFLNINILTAQWEQASTQEHQILNLSDTMPTFIREVAIVCNNTIWMYGRCIIPSITLTDQEVELMYLGNKPLGDYLYTHKNLKRSEFKFTHLENHWLRQSTIFLNNKPLLLTEVFMPEMINYV